MSIGKPEAVRTVSLLLLLAGLVWVEPMSPFACPTEQMKYFRDYLDSGKPLVALQTASHTFDTHGRHPGGAEGQTVHRQCRGE